MLLQKHLVNFYSVLKSPDSSHFCSLWSPNTPSDKPSRWFGKSSRLTRIQWNKIWVTHKASQHRTEETAVMCKCVDDSYTYTDIHTLHHEIWAVLMGSFLNMGSCFQNMQSVFWHTHIHTYVHTVYEYRMVVLAVLWSVCPLDRAACTSSFPLNVENTKTEPRRTFQPDCPEALIPPEICRVLHVIGGDWRSDRPFTIELDSNILPIQAH